MGGGLVDTAVLLGGVLVAPEHTVMQRLAERRISPQTIAVFDLQPYGNGWKYPIPGGGYRWKNADSKAADKYRWLDGKPQGADFYHAQNLASEVAQAGGACWFVSGEADTWAMYSAGIRHVLSGFTESHVAENLAEYLASLGVTVLYTAPDLDQTGARWVRLVVQTLQDSPIELDARTLPPELGDKADLGKAWAEYKKRQPFERYLLGLPRFKPEPLTKPQPAHPHAQAVNRLAIPQEYKNLIADILQATEYQGDGFAKKNVLCPFHKDKHPSASLHNEKGLFCHACGRWFTWNETGIKIGAGSLQEWRLANTYAVSTELREGLIKAKHSSLARLLDVLSLAGWQTGKEFTRKDVLVVAQELLTMKAIRTATKQLESYCPFFPPFSFTSCKKEKKGKYSRRPQKVYRLPSPADIASHLNVAPLHFDDMNPQKIKRAAEYRAEVYAALPRRKPGQYPRKTLAARVGVTNRTGQDYDKRAGLLVTPNISKAEMTPQELADLPEELPEDRKYNVWFEDERGKRYPPIKKAIDMIVRNGGGKVYRIEQFANTYQAGTPQEKSGDCEKV